MSLVRLGCGVFLGAMLASSFGCGPRVQTGEVVPVVPVSGTLTLDGKPLPGYQVTVLPVNGTRVAIGVSDQSGKFVLGTNKVGDGCPAGSCKVAVVWTPPDTAAENPGNEPIIDDPSKLPKPSIEIPKKYSNPDTSGLMMVVPEAGSDTFDIKLKS